jgi:hypothetical protein
MDVMNDSVSREWLQIYLKGGRTCRKEFPKSDRGAAVLRQIFTGPSQGKISGWSEEWEI